MWYSSWQKTRSRDISLSKCLLGLLLKPFLVSIPIPIFTKLSVHSVRREKMWQALFARRLVLSPPQVSTILHGRRVNWGSQEFIPVKGKKKVLWGLKYRITKTTRPKLSFLLAVWVQPFYFMQILICRPVLSCKICYLKQLFYSPGLCGVKPNIWQTILLQGNLGGWFSLLCIVSNLFTISLWGETSCQGWSVSHLQEHHAGSDICLYGHLQS